VESRSVRVDRQSPGKCRTGVASALAALILSASAAPLAAQGTVDPRSGRLMLSVTDLVRQMVEA